MDTVTEVVHANAPLTAARMRADIAEILGDADALDAARGDLIAAGLDSLTVMRLAARWRQAGVSVKFAELFERPTFAGWCELIDARQAGRDVANVVEVAGEPVTDDAEPFALATMQHAYWVGRDDNLVLGGVGTHFYAELDGAGVQAQRLDHAGRALAARHGMLRARMLDDGRQQILAVSPWTGLKVFDLRGLPPAQVAEELTAIRDRLSHRRFDVASGEVFDLGLSLLPDGATRIHVNIDMLVADAMSFRIIINDLALLYTAPDRPLPAIGYSYPRYLARRRAKPSGDHEAARAYWTRRLPELPRAPRLPLGMAPEKLPEHRVVRRHDWITPERWQVLAERARAHSVTLSMVFAAAFCEVVAAWSEEPDFLLNVPVFDREPLHPDVAKLVGDFSNLMIVGVTTSGCVSFVELARRLQERFAADAAHGAFSGLEVLRELARRDGTAHTLAPVVFTSALGLGDLFNTTVTEHFGTLGWNISQAPQVWLDHQVTEHSGGLLLNWDAVEALFVPGTLDAMFQGYLRIIDWLCAEPDWGRPAPSLLPQPQARRREELNLTAGPQRATVLHEGFFRLAAQHPDRTALLWDTNGRYSYGELAGRAARIAGALAARGCKPGDAVAVTLPKGPAQIEAVLGILRAGGVFVPVGVAQPASRRAAMYADARARWVLTDERLSAEDGWPATVEVLTVERARAAEPIAEPAAAGPDDLAYVIFTSGSTGVPKGVEMTHRAAMNTIEDIGDRCGIGEHDRGLAVSALDHDWSVYDMFAFLSVGGSLVLIDEAARRDGQRWAWLVRQHGVTVWTSVPALLDMAISASLPGQLSTLRLALVGGDWVGLDLYDRLRSQAPGARLVALGGATEVGIHSTWHEVVSVEPHWRSIPYGDPLRNQQVRVVDARGRDCPDWVAGELWLGGIGVGPGYRGDPQRTAQRFTEHDGVRWYRTGDLCRFLPDGSLELLGRTDFQVKLMGQRIDLGDVEAALRSHDAVRAAVALVVTGSGAPRLAAGVVTTGVLDQAELTAHLRAALPEYMCPKQIAVLDELPLNRNGKIDRGAIAGMLAETFQAPRPGEPPRGLIETDLARRWCELLNVAAVSRDDAFFTLGGDSLLATRLIAGLRDAGYGGATLTQLFATPGLRDFAAQLVAGAADTGPGAARAAITPDPARRFDPFPVTDVQRAYWLGRRPDFPLGGVGSHWYWEFDGAGVDLAAVQDAWNRLVARHDMLRAVFTDGHQRVLERVADVVIAVHDGADEPDEALQRMRDRLSQKVFAPDTWPLFDIEAVRYGGDRTRVGICLDFIALDAMSIMTVFSELAELYARPQTRLPELGLTFRDVIQARAATQWESEADRTYWMDRIDDIPPAPQLPLRHALAKVSGHRFVRREFRLPQAEWRRVVRRAGEAGVTASTVVAAAFATVLRAWSAQPAFTVNFTLFDRPEVHPDIQRVVGDFTSLLLVADRPEPGESFVAGARRLQRQIWSDMEHSSVSGLSVLREMARRGAGTEVLMPIVFTSTLGLRSATGNGFGLSSPFGGYETGLSQTPQVLLDHQVSELDGGLLLNWDAAEEVFADGVLDAMFSAYRDLLHRLAGDADWDSPARVPLPAGQAQVRERVNDTAGPRSGRLLHEAFFELAQRDPDRMAVAWGDSAGWTYHRLAQRARAIAAALPQALTPGEPVAVTLPKGPDQVAAVLAVLLAGGAYVPIGVDQPRVRRERILRDSGARFVVTDEATWQRAGEGATTSAVFVDGVPQAASFEPVKASPDQVAYLIYTSGSTGEPKGVAVSHQAAVNTIDDITDRFGVSARDRVLAVSSLDFDLSVYDIFGLLATGGALVMIGEEERRDAGAWLRLVRAHGVTLWNTVPALLEMLLVAAGDDLPGTLRLALVSGDWVALDLSARLAEASRDGCELVALGGATEAAIWSCAWPVTHIAPHWTSVPYGLPLRNQRMRVVADNADRPDWVAGEIWIGGAGVALGYHGDERRTRERFVESDGDRWYRTGDLGRYWPDGTVEFLGRVDHQVKLRGHRIELGELDAAVREHPGVIDAVSCLVPANAPALGTAVVVSPGLDAEAIREHLAARLPDYMIPSRILTVAALPLSANGKVDRAAIVALLADATAGEAAQPPQGEIEVRLAGLWASLLGHDVTDRHRGFFAAGGDSLLATRLVQLIRLHFGLDVALRDILSSLSLAAQARIIAAMQEQSDEQVEAGIL